MTLQDNQMARWELDMKEFQSCQKDLQKKNDDMMEQYLENPETERLNQRFNQDVSDYYHDMAGPDTQGATQELANLGNETSDLNTDSPDIVELSPTATSTPKQPKHQSKKCSRVLFPTQTNRGTTVHSPGPSGFSDVSGIAPMIIDIEEENRREPLYSQRENTQKLVTPPTEPLIRRVSSDSVKTASFDSFTYERPANNRSPPDLPDPTPEGDQPLSEQAEADFDIKAAQEMTQEKNPSSTQIAAMVRARNDIEMEQQDSDLPKKTPSFVKTFMEEEDEWMVDVLEPRQSPKRISEKDVSAQSQKKMKTQETEVDKGSTGSTKSQKETHTAGPSKSKGASPEAAKEAEEMEKEKYHNPLDTTIDMSLTPEDQDDIPDLDSDKDDDAVTTEEEG